MGSCCGIMLCGYLFVTSPPGCVNEPAVFVHDSSNALACFFVYIFRAWPADILILTLGSSSDVSTDSVLINDGRALFS